MLIVGYAGLEVGGDAVGSSEDQEYVLLRDEDIVAWQGDWICSDYFWPSS